MKIRLLALAMTGLLVLTACARKQATLTVRIVDGAETGVLMVADLDGGSGIYRLGADDGPVTIDGHPATADDLADGMKITITFDGMVQYSSPMGFYEIYALDGDGSSVDDRCGLYLQVLNDLWAAEPGLNEGATQLAVDLSGLTDLTPGEKAGLAWRFGEDCRLSPAMEVPLEVLWQEGYLTPMTAGGEEDPNLCAWEDGCLFSITGDAETGFEARKWRSGTESYAFSDCTARMAEDGSWTYTVGEEGAP